MEDYVRRYTAGSLLRSVAQIWWSNAMPLTGSALIPTIPAILIGLLRWQSEPAIWPLLLTLPLGLLNFAPYTVIISDICVGNEPSLRRAYGLAFGNLTVRVLQTGVLVMVICFVGGLLLVVPGVIFVLWYSFAASVVVLERTTARGALTRSRELGKGYYLRNAGLVLLTALVTFTPFQILGGIFGGVVRYFGFPLALANAFGGLLGAAGAVGMSIVVVLLYYDMRVRKEAYDSTKLAEDLRR